jgi:hypothetical protein
MLLRDKTTHMKIFFLLITLLSMNVGASAQEVSPEQAAKSFYEWYLKESNASRFPIRDDKAQMRARASTRLTRWLFSKAYEEYGADYFLDAQDYDENWVNHVSARRISLRSPKATVRITMSVPKGTQSGFGTRNLTIGLVKEAGAWKIDSVNNRPLVR